MPEPTSTAVATVATAAATVPALTAFGVPLGLQPELLVAGFAGALVAIVLLNAVPGPSDTWRELLRTTTRRIGAAVASSLTAGYLVPMLAASVSISQPVLLGMAFAAGAGAQQLLRKAIARVSATAGSAGEGA
ncbi:hypothetical protein ACG02S_07745 [Roseateles sp. DC23W]|uniref:Holin n=1 Tax=Pelomonas dachongensis TaxID=3299029 RepID=A0ABW7EP42_9BURK